MLKKIWLGMVFAGVLATSASTLSAEVVVRIGPPRPVVERRIARPGPGYVWVNGYQRWDGHAYGWVPGRWEQPPRPHARWQAHRWHQRHGQWVFEEGRWR